MKCERTGWMSMKEYKMQAQKAEGTVKGNIKHALNL
jgi:hypothetical protein